MFGEQDAMKSAPPQTSSFYGAAYEEYARLGSEAWENCLESYQDQGKLGLDIYQRCELRSHLSCGMYQPQLLRWERAFDKGQILVTSFDQLIEDPKRLQRRLYQHLGLSSCSRGSARIPQANSLNGVRLQQNGATDTSVKVIDCDTKARLRRLFAPWNAALFNSHPGLVAASSQQNMSWRASSLDRVPCKRGLARRLETSNVSEPGAVALAQSTFKSYHLGPAWKRMRSCLVM